MADEELLEEEEDTGKKKKKKKENDYLSLYGSRQENGGLCPQNDNTLSVR